MSSTGLAQAVSIACAPVLSRLYTPRDFGLFALWLSLASLLGTLATARYELAVLLPENDQDAIRLVAGILAVSFAVSSATLIGVWACHARIAEMLAQPGAAAWLVVLPAVVFLSGAQQALGSWANRKRQYGRLAGNRLWSTLLGSAVTLALGLAGWGIHGLVIGCAAGQAVATLILGCQVWRDVRGEVGSAATCAEMKAQLLRYRKFCLYTLPAEFVNVASNQAPAILLNAWYSPLVAGHFSLAQRALGMPVSLVAQSVYGVFRERATSDYRACGDCRGVFTRTLKGLGALSLGPLLALLILAPYLFEVVFGTAWRVAGEYARFLSLVYFLRLVCSPLSFVVIIAEKQAWDLAGQTLLLVLTVGSFGVGAYTASPMTGIVCFSVAYSVVYLAYLALSYHLAKR